MEILESRQVLTVAMSNLVGVSMSAGKDQLIPLQADESSLLPISYSASTNNPAVSATVETGGRSWRLNVSAVDGSGVPFTGTMEFRLFEAAAPLATNRIITLTQQGFYNNINFHRIIQDFMVQGGDPTASGSGGSSLPDFNDEFRNQDTFTSLGLLAYANSGDDTNDSQFFITDVGLTLAQLPEHLNYNHTIFGILTRGADVLQRLIATATTGNPSNTPLQSATITSATIFTDTQHGVLRVSAPEGFSGSVTVTANASNGLSGSSNTSTRQITLNVAADQINDRPFLGSISNLIVNEDTPITFDLSAFDRERDPITFTVRDGNDFFAALPNAAVSGFVTEASGNTPSIATITLTPNAQFNGTISVLLAARDQTVRDPQTGSINTATNFDSQKITLTVNAVNDAPDFAASNPPTVNEDPGAQSIPNWATFSAGPSNESTQTATYTVTVTSGASLFSVAPAVSPSGTLTYTLAPNANGPANFTVRVRDSGGTANGGVDLSAIKSFTLNVNPTNDAPDFTAANPPAINEDAPAQSIPNWAVFSAGPADEASQTATYLVNVTSGASLFSVAPAVSPSGTLTYTLAPHANGPATFSVQVRDNGGTASGGVELSAIKSFSLSVNPVNDAPDFTATNPPNANEDSGPQSIPNWAVFNAGPANESTQTATYLVSVTSGGSLFAVAPAISSNGTLTYTSAANATGTASFTVQVRDSGGTASGGVDLSSVKPFSLTIQNTYDPPVAANDVSFVLPDVTSPLTVLVNDAHDAPFDFSTLTITQSPAHGQAVVDSLTGEIDYTPEIGFTGVDSLRYTVRDNQNGLSSEALVHIFVDTHPWRNPDDAHDPSGSGGATNFDLFLVTADLRTNGPRQLPVPFTGSPSEMICFDIVGEGNIFNNSDLFELLSYLRQLSSQQGGEGEGTSVAQAPRSVVASTGTPFSAAASVVYNSLEESLSLQSKRLTDVPPTTESPLQVVSPSLALTSPGLEPAALNAPSLPALPLESTSPLESASENPATAELDAFWQWLGDSEISSELPLDL